MLYANFHNNHVTFMMKVNINAYQVTTPVTTVNAYQVTTLQ